MKLQLKASPNITSGDMTMTKMELDPGSMDMFTMFLRNQVYTDKVLACVREYASNAIDEHVKFNVDRPVEISLKEEDGVTIWRCRDYANGLDDEGVRKTFGMYGKSTKREDNRQHGVYGIGSKSFFSFTDTFYVTSYHQGVKRSYVCILGAGDKGVPIGEIYGISEEPTTETGLEIKADVSADVYNFDRVTTNFVKRFSGPSIRYEDQSHQVWCPEAPIRTEVIEGYSFSLYPIPLFNDSTYIAMRMGGVVYESRAIGLPRNPLGKVVVDVPIGKLTVPMSREGIEKTPSNDRVYKEIQKALGVLEKMDMVAVCGNVPKFGETVIATGLSYSSHYRGEWFEYNTRQLFPDTMQLKNMISCNGYPTNAEKQPNGKWMVYVIPRVKNNKNWLLRLTKCLEGLPGGLQPFYYVNNNVSFELLRNGTGTLDVADCMFVDIKGLGLPKLPRSGPQVAYQCIINSCKKGPWTPDQLEDYVANKEYNGVEIEEEWWKTVKTMADLNNRTIAMREDFSSHRPFWTVNSKKMKDAMLEIGWISRGGEEYAARFAQIQYEQKRQRDREQAKGNLNSNYLRTTFSPYLVKAIGNVPSRLHKLIEAKKKIEQEDSFRGRVLSNLGWSTITREDVRTLLRMKD